MNEATRQLIQNEHDTLTFWEKEHIFQKLREKNKEGPVFRFLDGPITANNPMGIHHAWGRTIKDAMLRYKAMTGHSCLYRNGFDTQGLWVEVEVEKELGTRDKKDVEAYGLEGFTRKCVARIEQYAATITEQSKRLGQWMDWDNSYYTHTDENITAIWHFLKVCHQNGWVKRASRPMPWCPRCGTSLSEHEMSGSHRDLTHTAVFARAPVTGKDFDMLVWTTTPWTLSANVALAVHPDLDYALVQPEGGGRPLVMAKQSLGLLEGGKQVLRLLKGSELDGLAYETFFPALEPQRDAAHSIVLWDEVQAGEGSGVVHIAPGCGAEDYALGQELGLPAICPVDEGGVFGPQYGLLAGQKAGEAATTVFGELERQGKLFRTHAYTHSYPVCWRCKTEVLFRLVQEWYIATDEARPLLLEAADTVRWDPPYAGKRMRDWLENMGDWNISRKRFYGLPLPFYPCPACGELTVVGSREELRRLGGGAVDKLPELRRPWIDEVTIPCPRCGETVRRVPEVGDVWLDAGITPFSTTGYFTDRQAWEKQFPAQWVVEMQEQIRLWFYSLLFMSVTLTGKAPYERVTTNSWVLAEDGSKFSKTGFMIPFDQVAEEMGADTARYLFAAAPRTGDMRFGFHLGEEARRKLLGLWNLRTFFLTYAQADRPTVTDTPSAHLADRWLDSRVNDYLGKVRSAYEDYDTPAVAREFESLVDDVSNWYVRTCRRRFWQAGMTEDKQDAYNTLHRALSALTRSMAPILPFLAESVWQQAILPFAQPGWAEQSVHLSDFPTPSPVDSELLEAVSQVRAVVAGGMKLRNEAGIKVKQPLSLLYVEQRLEAVCRPWEAVIREELNVKELQWLGDFSALTEQVLALEFREAGKVLRGAVQQVREHLESLPAREMAAHVACYKAGRPMTLNGFGQLPHQVFRIQTEQKPHILVVQSPLQIALCTAVTDELRQEGQFREILRRCQVLRKEAGFRLTDKVTLQFTGDAVLLAVVEHYGPRLEQETMSTIGPVARPLQTATVTLDGMVLDIRIA